MNEFYWIAVAVVTIVSAARLTRLATVDKFPPAKWVRDHFAEWTDKTPRRLQWQLLLFCGYCFSPWATALVVGWGYLAGVYDGAFDGSPAEKVWWLLYGILGASYAAAYVMAYDGDDGDDD